MCSASGQRKAYSCNSPTLNISRYSVPGVELTGGHLNKAHRERRMHFLTSSVKVNPAES